MTFQLVLVLILLGGWSASRLLERMGLPGVLGMLGMGLLLTRVFGGGIWPSALVELEPFLKSFALVVILLRAGLGIRRRTLNRIGKNVLAMAVLPCLLEAAALTGVLILFWEMEPATAALTGFMLAAVSPAVVIPSMLRLAEQGYGRKNEVPTLVLAGASVDDVLAITLFSLFLGLARNGTADLTGTLLQLPLSLILGILPGAALGFGLAAWFRRRHEQVRATEKTLVLLMTGLFLVQVGDWLHSAALLGVMTTGFLLLERAEPVAHELAAKLSKIWIFAEILLFVLIGMQVDPRLALSVGPQALGILLFGLFARSLGVWAATWGSPLERGERLFCVCAYWPKATVQAALGSVPLAMGIEGGEVILALAVLSILFTAPLGLLAIRWLGPRLLHLEPGELASCPD